MEVIARERKSDVLTIMILEQFFCCYIDSDFSFSRQNNATYLVFQKKKYMKAKDTTTY